MNIGRVIYKDYSMEGPAVIHVYKTALKNKSFKNIDSIHKLIMVVLMEAIKPTAIKSASLYAASALMGLAFFPAGVAGVILGDDTATETFNGSFTKTFNTALKLSQELGEVTITDKKQGVIKGKIYGCDVMITIRDLGWNKTQITVLARKFMLPKASIAEGLVYQIAERL